MEVHELLYQLFVNRNDSFAEAWINKENKRMAYAKKDEPLTRDIIKAHTEGSRTIGVYQLWEGLVRWGVFDFDENTQEDFDKAKNLYNFLKVKGYHPLLENSGGGPFKVHIWIFSKTDAASMRYFMQGICDECGIKPHEIFPKQESISPDGYGNLVKLPLALHLASGERSYLLNDEFKKEEDIGKILSYHLANQDKIDKVIIKEKKVIISGEAGNEEHCPFLDYCITHELPVGQRHEIISRNMAFYIHDKQNRDSLIETYISTQKGSEHELDGWIKGIEKGKATPICCGELINYQKSQKIPLKCRGCRKFSEYIKEKKIEKILKVKIEEEIKDENAKNEGFLLDHFNIMIDPLHIAKEFNKLQPFYYDDTKNWWIWNFKDKCYIMKDEVDILNSIDGKTKHPSVNSKVKNEILEAFKRIGRQNKPKDFPKDCIQFKDKIINYKTEEEFEANPEYFCVNPVPHNLGECEATPVMDSLFEQWVGSKSVPILSEIIAFCLLSEYAIHRIFFLLGGGSNGKTTYLRLLEKFIGLKNVCSSELEYLMKSRFEAARLFKKLVCVMGETDFEEMSETSRLKRLTGQEFMGFEFKNKTPFEDYNYAKIIIATNNLPPTTDKTHGFYRRCTIVDFPNEFEEKEILSSIPEEEYENLGRKCIRILKELMISMKFHEEGDIESRAKRYEDKSNPLDKFLNEYTLDEPDSSILKWEFEKRLNEWCKENRFRQIAATTIGRKMKEKGFGDSYDTIDWKNEYGIEVRKKFRAWRGLRWKD